MPKPYDAQKVQTLMNEITKDISEKLKNSDVDPGIVLIPSFRTEEQMRTSKDTLSGIFTNVANTELLQMALFYGVKAYTRHPKYKPYADALFDDETDRSASETALILGGALMAALADTDDWVKHLTAIILHFMETDIAENRAITMAVLPKNIGHGFKDAIRNSGMIATTDSPEEQVHFFATMVLSYCARYKIDVEQFANNLFGAIMTADVGVGGEDGNGTRK